MTKLAFVNARVLTPCPQENAVVLLDGDRVKDVLSAEAFAKLADANAYQQVDCAGKYVSPGFIDLQLNGCGGANFNETLENLSEATLEQMHATNIKYGCTSFLPTLITAPIEFRQKALEVVADLHARRPETKSYVPGLHIEGPHISLAKKGTHNPDFIYPMQDKDLELYLKNAHLIKILTLAVEENDLNKVKQLCDAGIAVSCGHSNATYEQVKAAYEVGVRTATHLYNGMSCSTSGRTPGVVGAVYDLPELAPGIIADGVHVNWPLVKLSLKTKQDHIFLVTDAVTPAGTDIKEFKFASKIIKVVDEACLDDAGCLSGSAITMSSMLRRLKQNTDFSVEQIVRWATYTPARQVGLENELGVLKAGAYANLVVFDDDFNVAQTYVNGKLVYQA